MTKAALVPAPPAALHTAIAGSGSDGWLDPVEQPADAIAGPMGVTTALAAEENPVLRRARTEPAVEGATQVEPKVARLLDAGAAAQGLDALAGGGAGAVALDVKALVAPLLAAGDTWGIVGAVLDYYFTKRPFNYLGGGGKTKMWKGEGDCATLSLEFVALMSAMGIAANTESIGAGPTGRIYVPAQKAIGKSSPGNITNGDGWMFMGHTYAVVEGKPVDVLYGQMGNVSHVMLQEDPAHPETRPGVKVFTNGAIKVASDQAIQGYRIVA